MIYDYAFVKKPKRSIKEKEILKDLYGLALSDLDKYDYLFFVPREFGYKQDGIRWQDETLAKSIDEAIKQFLDSENVPYITIEGSTKERSEKILEILNIKELSEQKKDA